MTALGYMPMPADFRYRAVIERGQPSTGKHPRMDTGHRAKIFAPFAALRGFDQAILSKDTLYEPKRMLAEEERAELLDTLDRIAANWRAIDAREREEAC